MSLLEVCALLRKSTAQVYRYVKDGLLHPVRNGRELVFDREEVLKFAELRGMHVPESEVPQGENFTSIRQAQRYIQEHLELGATLTLTGIAS